VKKEKKYSSCILINRGNIPEGNKSLLNERLLEFKKNPKAGIHWDTFVKELEKN
jgi:hypothetical protein